MSDTARKLKRVKVMRRDGERCVRCGFFGKEVRLTLDHVVPLSLGGNNELFNLQLLCDSCNQLKGSGIADYRQVAS